MNSEKIAEVIDHHLGEMTDGYLVIAFNGDTGEPIVRGSIPDAKTALAVNSVMASIMAAGGAGAVCGV